MCIRDSVTRKKKYEKYQATFSGRNSFSKTDTDATFMHLKEDHMRNAQLKPAYNLQLGVEGEYITGFDISSERSDQFTLIPLIDKMDKNIGVKYQDVTADAGYESEENYTYFENKKQACYIKPQKMCIRDRCKPKYGGDSKEDPPVPMPNTEVKLLHVDDTWRETARESR